MTPRLLHRILFILLISCFTLTAQGRAQTDDETYAKGLNSAIQGDFPAARETFKNVLAADDVVFKVLEDAQAKKIKEETAVAIFKGYKNALEGNWEVMIRSFNAAIENEGNYALAYLIRGSFYFDIETYDNALADYSKVIELDPSNLMAYLERAPLYIQKEKYDEAIADCTKAIGLNPTIETPYQNRGAAYYYKGQFDNAIADYQKVLEIQPRLVLVYYSLAIAYDDKGDKENALKFYKFFIEYAEKALALDTDTSEQERDRIKANIEETRERIKKIETR